MEAARKQSQTKPIYSFCVLRDAYCEENFIKQSQFAAGYYGIIAWNLIILWYQL
jgi:hypothetical protein